ncbi:MAG: AsmA-like C-terminal region-containing protein [Chitinispirillia bacterium]|nr:AsmA-like C-terminal region-containing protein [Chitinispirillia bacterium]
MNKLHNIEKVSTLVFLIISVALVVGFVPVRLGMFSGIAESTLKNVGADSVSVGGVSVSLWNGVRVHDFKAYKRINAAEDYRVHAHRVDISINLFRLAARLLFQPKSAHAENSRDVFHEAYEDPLEFIGGIRLIHTLKTVKLRGAGVNFTQKGKSWVSLNGVSADVSRQVEFRRALLDSSSGIIIFGRLFRQRITLAGVLNVREAAVPSIAKVEHFNVKLLAEGDRLDLFDGSGNIFGGKINTDMSFGFRRHSSHVLYGSESRILNGRVHIKGLDLDRFCNETGFSPGRMTGKVNADAEVVMETVAHIDSVKAKGALTVTRLTASDIALQRAPAVSQVSGDLRQLSFAQVKGKFDVAKSRLTFDELIGQGDILKFRSAGWIGFDGRLSHDFEGEFSPEFTAGLGRLVRNGLEPTEDGGGRFKCRITGTIERPRVDVDRSVYNRALRNLFK